MEAQVVVPYMTLDLPLRCVVLVDDLKKFNAFLSDLANHSLFGFDSEFFTGAKKEIQVSIMQIATQSTVYVLDLVALMQVLSNRKMSEFLERFCFNPKNTILGYSLGGDFWALGNTHRLFKKLRWKLTQFLDIEPLFRIMEDFMEMPFESDKKGLSGLVHKILGRPLDKTLQQSCWGERPLGASHVVYAALDAYILIQSFERLRALAEEQNELELFVNVQNQIRASLNKLPKWFKKEINEIYYKKKLEISFQTPLTSDSVTPKDIKLVCDKVLGTGLVSKLRIHGVDCIQPKKGETSERLSKSDNRIIVTKGEARAIKLKKYIKESKCLVLVSNQLSDQLNEVWKRLKIVDIEKFILTRCIICNCDQYLLLQPDTAKQLLGNMCSKNGLSEESGRKIPGSFQEKISVPVIQKSDRWTTANRGQVEISWNGKLPNGIAIKIATVPQEVLNSQHELFVCMICGKFEWEPICRGTKEATDSSLGMRECRDPIVLPQTYGKF